MIALTIVAGLLFLAVQMPNRLCPRYRLTGTAAAVIIAVLSIVLANDKGPPFIVVVVSILVLDQVFMFQVQADRNARRNEGLPLLNRSRRWNPFSIPGYRKAMFRDDWSRERLLTQSIRLPARLMRKDQDEDHGS